MRHLSDPKFEAHSGETPAPRLTAVAIGSRLRSALIGVPRALTLVLGLAIGLGVGVARASATGGSGEPANLVARDAWQAWSPREEIRPRLRWDGRVGHAERGSLRIDGAGNAAAFGGWRRTVEALPAGTPCRFTAWYRARGVEHERRSVIARLEWRDDSGRSVRPPDYALDVARDGEWTRVEYVAPVPEQARTAEITLSLAFAPKGTVWWDDVALEPVNQPRDRVVRVATIHHRPANRPSAAASVEEFCRLAETLAGRGPDLVCLPEGITVVGTGKTYADVSEPVPGSTTARLGELARRLRCYVVAGLYERVGPVVYNTAVLIGRDGSLVGRYRKTHLPREEWEAGIAPGGEYPVFDTDFGRVGLMICWDLQFPDPARALAAQGAEVIALPIWGGSEVLARARAIENAVVLVSSSYDMRSFVLDSTGQILAEATTASPVAVAEVHLDRPVYQPWLGNMKTRTWKERRVDLPVP